MTATIAKNTHQPGPGRIGNLHAIIRAYEGLGSKQLPVLPIRGLTEEQAAAVPTYKTIAEIALKALRAIEVHLECFTGDLAQCLKLRHREVYEVWGRSNNGFLSGYEVAERLRRIIT